MEIRVFDKEIMPLGIVDEMDTLIWQSTYWQQGEYGDVKILAPITDNNNKPLRIFAFDSGMLVSWEISELDALSGNVLIDKAVIEHSGIYELTKL